MKARQERVAFRECLGISSWLGVRLRGQRCFYSTPSFALRQLRKFAPRFASEARSISYGDIERCPGLRQDAYALALRCADEIGGDFVPLAKCGSVELGIDMELVIRKFLVETLFARYEFHGLARQYLAENSDGGAVLVAEPLRGDYPASEVKGTRRWPRLQYLLGLLAMPFYRWVFTRKFGDPAQPVIEDAVVCEIDGPKALAMFVDLFGQRSDLRFVAEAPYMGNFSADQIQVYGIRPRRLGRNGAARLAQVARLIQREGWRNFGRWAPYGPLLFQLYGTLARGILQTVDARRCTYFAYEHLFTTKAVRNEFMRFDGNRTVSFPYGTHVDSHFFAPSFQYNYDILCAAGELQERVYKLQQARTITFLRTGPYEVHKAIEDDGRTERVRQLREFKGSATSITILSSGIQDETRCGEIKLMALARQLAAEAGVRVFIRPKPVTPPLEYRGFYTDACHGIDSMLLTGSEYQLTDFLDVTDLFVTFWSHSAADLCAAGGQIVSIDFMEDDAVPLWQTAIDEYFLAADEAFANIMAWVNDTPPGRRAMQAERMAELRRLLCYRAPDFASYKASLLAKLQPWLPGGSAPAIP
jgi:hypothetical protein